jgi:ESS family glutamate:Na+ symporter
MILGIVLGMFFINIAYKRGYVKTVRPFNERSLHERKGIYPRHSRPNAGHQTVYSDSVDSLAWHVAIVGLAILVGFGMLKGLQAAETALFPAAKTRIFAGFPLFPLCMLGGVVLQSFARAIGLRLFIDRDQMQRIAGTALDFLSLAAVATIQISVVAQNWQPLLILIVAGAVWTAGSVFWFAPRLFRRAWFERAVTEFGQATGVTATGLLLLRTVDPENKTCAATTFGYKQLFHEPVMNTWVAIAITLILANPASWLGLWLFCTAVLALWLAAAAVLIHLNRKAARNEKA